MSPILRDIFLLGLCVGLVLLALTIIGERMRARFPKPDPAVEVFMTRIDSWWAMVVLFTLTMLAGRWAMVLLFAVASFAALREFYTYSSRTRADHLSLALAFYIILPAQFLFVFFDIQRLFAVFIPVYIFLLLPFVSVLRGSTERFLSRVSETQWGLMIAVYCLSHIPALMWLELPGYDGRGMLLIAFLVLVVQTGDLVDFYMGRRSGWRRIVPDLSPKTWGGAIWGIVAAAVLGLALFWITPFGPLAAAAMAALASASGQVGNLVLRAIKRDRGLRDWSHLIPGQGGFLDQLDSVIFAAPAFFHLTRLWWLAT
ncbi:phosphatidate cytidylyltransferase [Pararhodobacter zhoushanensis]|uniref:Phosphatidate cytidylyltransferase n=1 Tax=Pararhodobacter zhoushanensis TaxID=2479545 RepID=A0ABT3H262_9RHOB|nr:phosphatidate cytidylyltransferase [Pararhodobacter zhoushanensis]MCW1933861.1 phosphatidate cytidylyltransferase [Pararhodobacter zhoushanensis]